VKSFTSSAASGSKTAIYLRKQDLRGLTVERERRYTRRPMAGSERSKSWAGLGTGWTITSMILGGMLAWGGIGYGIDWLAGTPRIFTAIGFVLGGGGGIYLVYLRYGRERGGDDGT
jgi:ATP synthase protein I